ncbi:RNA polymerase subunit sigma-24 [Nonomuraea sp. MG754425]|uniref:nuclear transport factor 2 family protein n=1 Tax=Nonomuraea sp. MG754425 TaxID=2570319 RepID=UPI001F1DF116|nr:nuclear transport factor 2 family protein [Nonomuraea sp. MG754425]MCF6473178.1 RNA polymerase subunit sigma-24 [Nonomuraea sp. MG754425]
MMREPPAADGTEAFADHRELLFSIVYNMLGTVGGTEEVLHETWLAWSERDANMIADPRGHLLWIAVTQAHAHQISLRRRTEANLAPGACRDPEADMLDLLTPLQRAVFVLHQSFDFQDTEIAAVLDCGPLVVRQIIGQILEQVRERCPPGEAIRHTPQEVAGRFAEAVVRGDRAVLMEMLAPDATLWCGAEEPAVAEPHTVHGRRRIAAMFAASAGVDVGVNVRFHQVIGDPTVVLFSPGAPFMVMVLDLDGEGTQVCGIHMVRNSDKIASAVDRDPLRPSSFPTEDPT